MSEKNIRKILRMKLAEKICQKNIVRKKLSEKIVRKMAENIVRNKFLDYSNISDLIFKIFKKNLHKKIVRKVVIVVKKSIVSKQIVRKISEKFLE